MSHDRVRRSIRRGDDTGSAVAFVPILGLLFFAGIAALVGIALQQDESSATPEPAPITAAQLGRPCTDAAGPVPTGVLARAEWLRTVSTCVNARIEGALGEAAASTNSGYGGVVVAETFNGRPAIVVRWNTQPPNVVVGWSALHPNSIVTVSWPAGS